MRYRVDKLSQGTYNVFFKPSGWFRRWIFIQECQTEDEAEKLIKTWVPRDKVITSFWYNSRGEMEL